jgi:hypothetical protein
MKKIAFAGLIVVAVNLVAVASSEARRGGHHHRGHHHHGHRHHGHHHGHHHHARFVFGFGHSVWWGGYPYWHYPPVVYAPAVVYAPPPPPVVVQEAPPVYLQQAPAPAPTAEQFWYYCQSAGGYYPTVSSCPEAWVKVAPRP